MSIEYKQIMEIKKHGHLLALDPVRSYWKKGNVIYSVNVDGYHYCTFCNIESLGRHLHKIYNITGSKMFSEGINMVIIDRNFFSDYQYA